MISEPLFWLGVLAVAAAMEPWSMWVHGRLWHGMLWWGHRSHHEPKTGRFELNDLFAAIHAPVAMLLIIYGFEAGDTPLNHALIAIGFGMTLFGISYFVVHDGFIHGRLPVQFLARWRYFRRVRNAHNAHHHREHVPPYGLFLGPQELRWYQARRRLARLNPGVNPAEPELRAR